MSKLPAGRRHGRQRGRRPLGSSRVRAATHCAPDCNSGKPPHSLPSTFKVAPGPTYCGEPGNTFHDWFHGTGSVSVSTMGQIVWSEAWQDLHLTAHVRILVIPARVPCQKCLGVSRGLPCTPARLSRLLAGAGPFVGNVIRASPVLAAVEQFIGNSLQG